jgi:hypothetical protein
MGAALSVLDLRAEQSRCAAVHGLCDLLRAYHARARQQALACPLRPGRAPLPQLREMSQDLEKALGVLEKVNGDGSGDEVLHAVTYLLRMARGLAVGGAPPPATGARARPRGG